MNLFSNEDTYALLRDPVSFADHEVLLACKDGWLDYTNERKVEKYWLDRFDFACKEIKECRTFADCRRKISRIRRTRII